MAGMLGQLGSQGAAGLSQANIDKLKASEKEAKVKPIENNLSKWEQESAALSNIKTKVSEFLEATKAFDLYSPQDNAFEQLSANTEGSSATFKSLDGATVDPGNTDVYIKQLATRDVYQSGQIFDMNSMIHPETTPPAAPELPKEPKEPDNYYSYGFINASDEYEQYQQELEAYNQEMESLESTQEEYKQRMLEYDQFMAEKRMEFQQDAGLAPKLVVDNGEQVYEFETYGKTYKELFDEMNSVEGLDVSLAKVTKDSNRIAIKSVETGTENALAISQNNLSLGFGPNDNSHVVVAQDMVANIDGIDYENSSNTMEIKPGLVMTAVSAGKSSINIDRDDGTIMPAIMNFVDKYNMLTEELNNATINPQSPINDRSSLRMIQSQVKDILMQNYGTNGENNLFVNGLGFDKQGKLNVDQSKLSMEISNNYGLIKEMFVGNKTTMTSGMGTRMSEYIDSLDGFGGGLSLYESNLNHRKEVLEKDKKQAMEQLDQKYEDLANKYAAYADVINKMETSFKGFQNMIRGG